MKIKYLLAGAVAAAGLTAGVVTSSASVASADTGWTLTGNSGLPNDFWFHPDDPDVWAEMGPNDPTGCNKLGTSTKAFSTTTTFNQYSPLAGKVMTFSGTMTLGPQTEFNEGVGSGDDVYGFDANYGQVTSLTGTFSINTTPVITGTFDGLAAPFGTGTNGNIGSCYGVGAGDYLGWSDISNGALIAVRANVNYTATQNGETITGKVLLNQRQMSAMLPAPWFQQGSYSGPDVSFYGTAQPPTPADTTPPTITATDGLHFAQGSSATPNFSCADEVGGSGLASCVGSVATLDTATPGTKTYTVNATDNAGNPASRTVTYVVDAPAPPVLHYNVDGFFQPIDMVAVNSAKAGQTIPAKWKLTDANGALVSDPASFVSATSSLVSCATNVPTDAIEEYTSGDSGLQYNNGTWQFNWKTPKSYAGTCRVFSVNLADGSHITAKFQFKS